MKVGRLVVLSSFVTCLIAPLLDLFGRVTAEDALKAPKDRVPERMVRQQVGGE